MTIRRGLLLTLTLLFIVSVPELVRADARQAWKALHNLEVAKAIDLFEAARQKTPDDHSLIRGLILAYYFDGQRAPQIRLIREAIAVDPANPYNLALFEHLAAGFTTHAEYRGLAKEVAESMLGLPPGPMRFCGQMIFDSYARRTLVAYPDDFKRTLGVPPAAWVSGPFENNSRVSAVRLLSGETSALDTSEVTSGKDGVRVTWVNLKSSTYGDFYTGAVMENRLNAAVQMRFPFRLGSSRDVIVVLGGAFHYRLRIDGREIAEDRRFSNAVVRDALRIHLDAGEHEITLVAGWEDQKTDISLHVLDTLYREIPDLTWPRIAGPQGSPADSATRVNPIFDSFEAYVRKVGEAPDTRYWRAVLHMYNAKEAEAVQNLEELDRGDSLSLLEKWCLITALYVNDEAEQAVLHLSRMRQKVTVPLVELLWMQASQDDNATLIRNAAKLAQEYPGRPMIEAIATGVPLLDGDIAGFLEKAREFESRFPKELMMKQTLTGIYGRTLNDYDAALGTFLDMCDLGQDKYAELIQGPGYYIQARKFDKAMTLSLEALQRVPENDIAIGSLVQCAIAAGRSQEALTILDSLIDVYPTNIDLLSSSYDLCRQTNRHEQARRILEKIHFLKPTAWMPYQQVDSLHNFAPYDSIFTPVDVMSLWDDPPSEEELKGQGVYMLLDRRQVIIFESGAAYNDIHIAMVLLDKSNVEAHQEIDIGFYPSSGYANLLVARRLRKGAPPHAGQHDETSVYFQDLQPGDAIELHYRIWEAAHGDLWRQYWDEYQTGANIYQRSWEYTILTNRKDCKFASTRSDIEPVVDTHFNYIRTTWREDNAPATDDNPVYAPPHDDIMGKIFATTLSDWKELGNWYAAISEAVLDENPRAGQLARRLIQGAEGDREKLHRLYKSVVFDIPYQVMDFDYSACVPHSPDEVLINRWGDCKDKAHLLIAMLREADIRSWPVLVMTRTEGTQLPLPYMGFNHVIVGCIIEGDTLYVDPSGEPSPPEHSIELSTAGQPCLHIFPNGGSFAGHVPSLEPSDLWETWTLSIGQPDSEGRYQFRISREFGNLSAGSRRDLYRDETPAQLIEDKESYFSDNWGVTTEIDSLEMDSLNTIDPVFSDRFSGYMTLSTQQIGNTAIIQPPKWCPFQNSLPTDLFSQGSRDYPVDLRYACGDSRYILKVKVPEGFGDPQVPEPIDFHSPMLNFVYGYSYDKDAHELALTYHISIADGKLPVDTFLTYVKMVLGAFDSPILLQKEI